MYFESQLTDLGYVDEAGSPVASIEGRDNCGKCIDGQGHVCCCFRHLGISGYPTVPVSFIDERPGVSVAFISQVLPDGVMELTEAEFVEKLVSDYGWPAGTTMGMDGRPHGPDRTVPDDVFYQVSGK